MIIPIVDTLLVTTTRKLTGRPLSTGGLDHTTHRLLPPGMTERRSAVGGTVLRVLSVLGTEALVSASA